MGLLLFAGNAGIELRELGCSVGFGPQRSVLQILGIYADTDMPVVGLSLGCSQRSILIFWGLVSLG